MLGLAKALIAQGQGQASLKILINIPASREYASAEKLRPLAKALERVEKNEEESEDFLDAAYDRSLRLIRLGNIPAAMDGLLDILRQDKRYRNEEARKVMLGLFELLGDDQEITRQYRSEMASILF